MNLEVDDREFHSLLAALRCYHDYLTTHPIYPDYDDIASNLGAFEPLEAPEIDALFDRLNESSNS
jgi:hypothetical protein